MKLAASRSMLPLAAVLTLCFVSCTKKDSKEEQPAAEIHIVAMLHGVELHPSRKEPRSVNLVGAFRPRGLQDQDAIHRMVVPGQLHLRCPTPAVCREHWSEVTDAVSARCWMLSFVGRPYVHKLKVDFGKVSAGSYPVKVEPLGNQKLCEEIEDAFFLLVAGSDPNIKFKILPPDEDSTDRPAWLRDKK